MYIYTLDPSDFNRAASGQVTFIPNGPNEITIQLRVREDRILELNETFTLRLALPPASITAGGQLGFKNAAEVTIINDDCKTGICESDKLDCSYFIHSCTSILCKQHGNNR